MGDSVVYEYLSNKKINRIYYFLAKKLFRYDTISYDSFGKLIEVSRFQSNHNIISRYLFHYNQNNLPNKFTRNIYGNLTEFDVAYDSKNRVVSISSNFFQHYRRYTYNDSDNVVELFYLPTTSLDQEVIARVNKKFDKNKRFWGDSKELKMIYTLIYFFEPSASNVEETLVFYSSPNTYTFPAQRTLFTYEINADSLPTLMFARSASGMGETTEPLFRKAEFICE